MTETQNTINDFNVNEINGERKVYFLCRTDAHRIIVEENIDWSYAKIFRVDRRGFWQRGDKWDMSIHYFNSENKEVAYYCVCMEVLTIFAKPREYSPEYINDMDTYHINDSGKFDNVLMTIRV